MATIVKYVDRAVTSNKRNQTFTQADASAGDVLDINASLGRDARSTSIYSANGMSVLINANLTLFPSRDNMPLTPLDDISFGMPGLPNLTSGVNIQDSSITPMPILAGSVLVLDELPVSDIKIVTASGNWTIITY